jgi:hypothetical protein
MLLDKQLRAQWHAMAKLPAGPVVGAIRLCEEARTTRDHDRALYQGSAWARVLQACLVAWAATDSKDDAATAVKYFTALIDDLDRLGDGRGGDDAAQRDHGYAIRNLGPYTALAYDWLHPLLPPELQARARQRWKAWLAWYRDKGYRPSTPGSNYHAGYLIAATMIAIAQAGDAGPDGAALWQHVADQMWGKEMAAALSQEGALAGGNWPEGWQYGPLSVAEYSLGARLMKRAGVEIPGVETWLSSLMRHHVYSLSPADGVYATGDTETETATLPPHVLTLDAIAFGDATPEDKRWARGELARLKLADRDWFLYDALAAVGDKPTLPPRSAWPTWYLAANTGTLYTRTRWDESAIWFVAECSKTLDTDHRHRSAGNFVLSRGRDDVIVDPSPYGSQSTLTSNAPTVASGQLPADYIPSQGAWSDKTGYDFVTQRASGVVAARCDYADAYKMQQKPSDIADAVRDFVLLPSTDGRDAALLVIDRATTGASDRGMHLRFRTPGQLTLDDKGIGTTTVGATKLAISSITRSAPGTTAIGTPRATSCYKEQELPKGQCDAARVPVTDYRVQVPGPTPAAVHLLTATGAQAPATIATPIAGKGWAGVKVSGLRDAVVVWRTHRDGALDYSAPPGTHVILDPPDVNADVTAKRDGNGCAVHVTGGGKLPARPLVISVDAACSIKLDAEAPAASAIGTRAPRTRAGGARSPRSGCCGAEAAPGTSFAMAFVVVAILRRRRAS